jgi:glucokinase
MMLAGDVGATKTVLAVLDPAKGMSIVRETILPSREIESLESAVEAFLLGARRLKVSAARPLLDTFSPASLHCRVHPEACRSDVALSRSAEPAP